MQLNKLQLDFLEHDYGRRHIMVPRSGSVKILELQSALAQKCAAMVEIEAVQEANAATILSFKMAVAAVCPPLPPTHLNGSRKIVINAPSSVCSRRHEPTNADQSGINAEGPMEIIPVKAPRPSLPCHELAQPPKPLDPNARPFEPRQPRRTQARARRNRRRRSDRRRTAALAIKTCPAANSKQRRALSREAKQVAWQTAQAELLQHGEVQQHGAVQTKEEMHLSSEQKAAHKGPEAFSHEQLIALDMAQLADAAARDQLASERDAAAECALAASRDIREAKREAETYSRQWCGPAPVSIFDVPTPPLCFVQNWYWRNTPAVGDQNAKFGKQSFVRSLFGIEGIKLLKRRKHWTSDGKAIDYGDNNFIGRNKVCASSLGWFD